MKFLKSIGIIALIFAAFVFGKKWYMTPDYGDGELAPNFSGKTPNGQNLQLSDLEGNYVLLDFWGSWCGPCIADFKKLRPLNSQFKDKKFKDAEGFKVLGVGIEKSEKHWLRGIEKRELDWLHVLDLNTDFKFFDSEIAGKYGVKEVPTKFLIAPNGQILGVNWSAEKIETYLSERVI